MVFWSHPVGINNAGGRIFQRSPRNLMVRAYSSDDIHKILVEICCVRVSEVDKAD
jgi:hypothetical protein